MEQRDNQEATAIIQVLDKIGLTSVVAVKIMVNGQILIVWMWGMMKEKQKIESGFLLKDLEEWSCYSRRQQRL